MLGCPNTARSTCAPTNPKKNGVKKAATGAVSVSSASRSADSPTTIPARNAPMIAARPMTAARAARPSITIIPGRKGVSANRGLGQDRPMAGQDPGSRQQHDPDERRGQAQR